MKKRFSLVLAVVLAVTTLMGMSIMAYAEWEPLTIDCGTDEHKNYNHFYVYTTETYETSIGDVVNVNVSGWYLKYMEDEELEIFDAREGNTGNNRAIRAN